MLVPKYFTSLFDNGLVAIVWGFLVMAAGLLAIATSLGVILVVPIYSFYRVSSTLQSWIRQRVVEEMLGTGMTGRGILDSLAWYGTRWWLMASLPGALASIALFPELRGPWLPAAIAGYLLMGAAIAYLWLGMVAWSSYPGGKAATTLVGPVVVLQLLPAAVVSELGLNPISLLAASLYMIFMGRLVAIYGLENWESLGQFDNKARRFIRRKMGARASKLSENPIAARESMRGMDAADLSIKLLTLGGFLLATVAALTTEGYWVFAFLMVPVVLINSYMGAVEMSQMVTQETECSTLETVRSTPITSDDFLKGWLRAVVVPRWRDHALLLLGVSVVMILMGDGAHLGKGLVIAGACLSLVLPLAGAYIGASIAGQAKTRGQISGQLLMSLGAVALIGAPQVMASAQLVSLPASLGVLAVVTAAFCWVLDAGAKKSLNRVFLPQR